MMEFKKVRIKEVDKASPDNCCWRCGMTRREVLWNNAFCAYDYQTHLWRSEGGKYGVEEER